MPSEEERVSGVLMTWWAGDGAAEIPAYDDAVLLLERAGGSASLADMAKRKQDDRACRILCAVVVQLHAPWGTPVPNLPELGEWFHSLMVAAPAGPAVLTRCADTARSLLAASREPGVLRPFSSFRSPTWRRKVAAASWQATTLLSWILTSSRQRAIDSSAAQASRPSSASRIYGG